MRSLILSWVLALGSLTLSLAQDAPTYAIAIHGGAGSHPKNFSKEANAKRANSMRQALTAGVDILKGGGSSLDAVEAVVAFLEDDEQFNAGKGAVFNAAGGHELDASIMDGKTLACGAVAGVTTVKNPIKLARKVMTETRHVPLSGTGADQFAKEQKVPLVDQAYFHTEAAKKELEGNQANEKRQSAVSADSSHIIKGTVGCVALDKNGNLAAATSTGGLSNKKFGRVGDSPIVGAGTYADNRTCAVSCTGVGEEHIRRAIAYDVSAQLRYAKTPIEASVKDILTNRLDKGMGGIIALDHSGKITMQFNTGGMPRAAADSNGRFEVLWGTNETTGNLVTVLGFVENPGLLYFEDKSITLVDAIEKAGGLTNIASRNRIKVFRAPDQSLNQSYDPAKPFQLRNGDFIHVGQIVD